MKLKHLSTITVTILAVLLGLFLDGKINIPGNPLPSLAKFLHPSKGMWSNAEFTPSKEVKLTMNQLSGKAEIIYDDRWVPHIYAENINDALFLQGYVEAQNRLFQMDFMTRAASGRLSEVMGLRTLQFDKARNRSMIEDAAENAIKSWEKDKTTYALLEKYVEGVNAYISSLDAEDYPYEYKLLGFAPEPWTAKKVHLFTNQWQMCLPDIQTILNQVMHLQF